MMTCSQVRLLLSYNAKPGTKGRGLPELGFHLALCAECRSIWEQKRDQEHSCTTISHLPHAVNTEHVVAGVPDSTVKASDTSNLAADSVFMPVFLPEEGAAISARTVIDVQTSPSEAKDDNEVHLDHGEQIVVSYRTLLRNRNFRLLWLGQAISTFGSYFTRIAVPIYVFSLTNSYAHLGFAYFSSLIASLLFGLFAGALADRWEPRRTMILADIGNASVLSGLLLCMTLPFGVAVKLGTLYVVGFVAALLREIFIPARIAIFTDVVAQHELLAANALDEATTTFGELISYPAAALALYLVGSSVAFAVDALTFVLSALLLWKVQSAVVVRYPTEVSNIWREISEGLQIVRTFQAIRKVIILSLIVPLCMSLLNTLQLPFAVEALGSTQEVGFPILEAAMAIGLMLGMLALGHWGQHIQRSFLLAYGIGGYGLAVLIQGLIPYLHGAAELHNSRALHSPLTSLLFAVVPFALLSGAANSLILASIRTLIQEQAPRPMLGRVYSVKSVVGGFGFAVGALLTSIAQGRVVTILILLGGLLVLLGVVCRWWLPEKRSTLVLQPHL